MKIQCNFCTMALPALMAFFFGNPGMAEEAAGSATSQTDVSTPLRSDKVPDSAVDWLTGDGVSLGGYLFPHLHAFGVFGGSTGDSEFLANGHHDPQGDATLQALEPGASLRVGDHLQGFATYSANTDGEGHFDGAWEEAFLKLVDLPFDLELRGGLFLNRFGFQNALHNHGWLYVDQNLVNGRLLQEGELATIGGEVTWNLPTPWTSALSTSVGGLPSAHEHDHEHAHGGDDPGFEAEGANFDSWLAGANYVAKYDYNDFHQFTGTLSGAWGDNAFGRNTSLYGVGLEYLWRENGYEPGGLSVRFRNEVMLRRIDALSGHLPGEEDPDHDEHGAHQEEASHAATLDEMGASSLLVLGVNDRFETGVRGGWVSGIGEMSLDERWQVSPMLTYYLNSNRTLLTRVQYNWDHSDSFGDEHSIWFQIGFNWGGAEVR